MFNRKAFYQAVRDGDVNALEANPGYLEQDEHNALCLALRHGRVNVVIWLRSKCIYDYNSLVYLYAGKYGHTSLIDYKLSLGSVLGNDPKNINFDLPVLLESSANYGRVNVLQHCHQLGVDLRVTQRRSQLPIVLTHAASRGQLKVLRLMHQLYPQDGQVWIQARLAKLAVEGGHLHVLKFLKKHHLMGEELPDGIDFMMYKAVEKRRLAVVKWLVEHYPEQAASGRVLCSSLYIASKKSWLEGFLYLREIGAGFDTYMVLGLNHEYELNRATRFMLSYILRDCPDCFLTSKHAVCRVFTLQFLDKKMHPLFEERLEISKLYAALLSSLPESDNHPVNTLRALKRVNLAEASLFSHDLERIIRGQHEVIKLAQLAQLVKLLLQNSFDNTPDNLKICSQLGTLFYHLYARLQPELVDNQLLKLSAILSIASNISQQISIYTCYALMRLIDVDGIIQIDEGQQVIDMFEDLLRSNIQKAMDCIAGLKSYYENELNIEIQRFSPHPFLPIENYLLKISQQKLQDALKEKNAVNKREVQSLSSVHGNVRPLKRCSSMFDMRSIQKNEAAVVRKMHK